MASRKRSISSNDATNVSALALYKEWDEASCPICMDHPHNAVLLICTSHHKGCRSYICDTSYRHSNCLDRFKKLKDENTNTENTPTVNSNLNLEMEKFEEGLNLRCPLCRGAVLGWKVVDDSRKYLNMKSRSCSRDSCSFSGNYGELRGHARRVHPQVHPANVDPTRERDWRRLESQREYNDIVSAVSSAIPGATVVGDYVIESGEYNNRLSTTTFFLFQMIGSSMDGGGGGGGEIRGGRSRVRHSRPGGARFVRRRNMWGGGNSLGVRENQEDENEVDLNVVSGFGDSGGSNPRRRRRLRRARSNENHQ